MTKDERTVEERIDAGERIVWEDEFNEDTLRRVGYPVGAKPVSGSQIVIMETVTDYCEECGDDAAVYWKNAPMRGFAPNKPRWAVPIKRSFCTPCFESLRRSTLLKWAPRHKPQADTLNMDDQEANEAFRQMTSGLEIDFVEETDFVEEDDYFSEGSKWPSSRTSSQRAKPGSPVTFTARKTVIGSNAPHNAPPSPS